MAMGNSDETLNAVIDRAEELARAGEREQAESVYRSALAAGLDVRLDYANLLSE